MKPGKESYVFPGNGSLEERERWWRDRFERFLSESTELIVDSLGGASVRSIFLIGSFAAGEGSVALEAADPVVCSDFDFAAILDSFDAFKRLYPLRRELGARCGELLGDLSLLGRVDIGMYLAEDLKALSAKPGVYDFKRGGRVLYGDPADRDLIPDYRPSDIGGGEAVALIENRIVPHLAAFPEPAPAGEAERYRFLYQIARAYTDILTASLSIKGRYLPGYGARCTLLREGGVASEIRDLAPGVTVSDFERWTGFKIRPSIASLGLDLSRAGVTVLWEEASSDLIAFWRRAEAARQGCRGDESPSLAAEALLRSRKSGRGGIRHLRSWKASMSGLNPPAKFALGVALGRGLFRRAPLDIIREHGVLLLERSVRGMRDAAVPVPAGGFPHGGGDWSEAAAAVTSRWERAVFG